VDRLCGWFVENLGPDVPLHFTAFHPDFKMTAQPSTPAETCRRAREQAKRHGIRHVYSGNIHDRAGQSTYCAGCGTVVIERDWYALGRYGLVEERCATCGEATPGRFAGQPPRAQWGRKRLRVALD
jgi:pyruvate formate lyase activating enzyme